MMNILKYLFLRKARNRKLERKCPSSKIKFSKMATSSFHVSSINSCCLGNVSRTQESSGNQAYVPHLKSNYIRNVSCFYYQSCKLYLLEKVALTK